jgi:hypothetical protein
MSTVVNGTIWDHGAPYADGSPQLEIHVPIERADGLSFQFGRRVSMKLRVGQSEYEAGLRSTRKNRYVWICPDVKSLRGDKQTLGRVLTDAGFGANDAVRLECKGTAITVHRDGQTSPSDEHNARRARRRPAGSERADLAEKPADRGVGKEHSTKRRLFEVLDATPRPYRGVDSLVARAYGDPKAEPSGRTALYELEADGYAVHFGTGVGTFALSPKGAAERVRLGLPPVAAYGVPAAPTADPTPQVETAPAPRRLAYANRLVRDSAVAEEVKAAHGCRCQVCGLRLETPAGPYAEGAHVRPLGSPHGGPDVPENVLCLCPNHHVLFDAGAFSICDDLTLIKLDGRLRTVPSHQLAPEYLHYHREWFGLSSRQV